jgi:hypothetical protein
VVINVKIRANVVKVVVVIAVSVETLGDLLWRRAGVKPLTKKGATIIRFPIPDAFMSRPLADLFPIPLYA